MMLWAKVVRVIVFKADLGTHDEIYLRFESQDSSILISEEATGWKELLNALPSHLEGCWAPETIHDAVVQPAFATNETVIYEGGKRAV